jgi:hypothetical protein
LKPLSYLALPVPKLLKNGPAEAPPTVSTLKGTDVVFVTLWFGRLVHPPSGPMYHVTG